MRKFISICKFAIIYAAVAVLCLSGSTITDYAVTAIAENSPIPSRKCVVIDAGHGGVDGGAVSCTGIYESKVNLQIAQRLDDLFHLLGYKTVMLRSTDTDLSRGEGTIAQRKISDLKERVRIINETKNGVPVSIHQNHFQNSRYQGAQVFYANTEGSKELAGKLQAKLREILHPENNRKIKRSEGVYLMEHIACTGTLIECGFLSNPEEEAKLRSEEYQKILCAVIGTTVSTYLNT